MKKDRILLIGLVDLNRNGGDVAHFKILLDSLENVFKVTVGAIGEHKRINISVLYPKNKFIRVIYWNLVLFLKGFNYLLNHRVLLIYFRESGLVVSPYFLALLFRVPIFVEVNGVMLDDLPLPKKLIKWFFTYIYRIPQGFFASKGYAKLLESSFSVNKKTIELVHLGYNFEINSTQFVPEIYINSNKTIAFVGNLHPYQGLYSFIMGFKSYLEFTQRNDIYLKIFGDGIDKSRLMSLVEDFGLSSKIQFFGFVSQDRLVSILRGVDLCISPFSLNRGEVYTISALKTYQYFNARKPILTSIMDENANFIKEQGFGDYLENSTDEEIVEKLINLLSVETQDKIYQAYSNDFDKISHDLTWKHRFDIIISKLTKSIKA